MYNKASSLLFTYLFTFGFIQPGRAWLEGAPSAELLPDGLAAFHDYEIISIREEGDEDVVRLRKRAGDDKNCEGTDCLTYSAWEDDRDLECDNEGNVLRGRSLFKRGKDATVCEGALVGGKSFSGFETAALSWPSPGKLEKEYKMVYDIGDPTEPLKPEWYKVKRRQKKWKGDVTARKGGRCYAAEHVLEWQLLKMFIEEDMDSPDSRCAFFVKHMTKPLPALKKNIKVKVAKDYKKNLKAGEHFDYEEKDFEFSLFDGVPRAIDWITYQWPGKKSVQKGRVPSPWEYELVVLNQDMNGKKANVWAGQRVFKEPVTEGNSKKMSQKNQQNSETLEWLFVNKRFKDNKIDQWDKNKGTCAAVYKFNTAMGIAQYHNDPYVQEVLRAQVGRVADAFEYVEKNVLPGTVYSPGPGQKDEPFKERNLKKEWIDWFKKTHQKRLHVLNKALEEKVSIFEGKAKYDIKVKKWDFAGVFSRAAKDQLQCGEEPDKANMEKRIKLLLDAYKNMPKAETKFKLGNSEDEDMEDLIPSDPDDEDYEPSSDESEDSDEFEPDTSDESMGELSD